MLATQQLTEFLSVVADRPGGPAAQHAAVECAARALDADVAVLMIDHSVAAAYGIAATDVPAHAISEIAAGRRGGLELGGRAYAVTLAPIGGESPGVLIVGRAGQAFSTEEVCLLRGMARVLELSLSALTTIESEQHYARENDRLLDYLQQRQRLFEQLTAVQRQIARRLPLDQIFQTITGAVLEMLDVDMCSLNLLDPEDPTRGSMVAANGVIPGVNDTLRSIPLVEGGITGLAILGNELIMVEDYTASPITIPSMSAAKLHSVMSTPIHENDQAVGSLTVGTYGRQRSWDKASQEILTAFAEHASLAITDARTLEAMSQAFHDALTGLPTRPLFVTRMEEQLAAGSLAVLLIDLDRFKTVNDSLGHNYGDRLLVAVAERIGACLREHDVAARLGGDEFAVLLPGVTGPEEAEPIAERILTLLREPFTLGDTEAYVSSSIGIAYSGQGEYDAKELVIHADLAMYQAKKLGKDRAERYRPQMKEAFRAGVELEADLRRAVVRHEFELRYQPIVDLRTHEITGVEALIRWQHPTRGMVPPLDFIPLAEETGLIVPIGEWVLREATRRVGEWNTLRPGQPLSVSVNLSAVQLEQAALPRIVASALADAGLPPRSLVLELTESLLVDHRPATLERLQEIKALGVRLAIDDFGTGYSSLAYLRRFPVDIIKIDKSFVDDVEDEPTAAALTHGIIQLGRALQLSTVAEGIEDAAQLSSLTGGDCDYGQGYYFAEPLTGAALGDLLFPPNGA